MHLLKLSESTAARRRLLISLVDSADGSPETGVTISAGDVKISKNGGAEANHAGTLTELGGGAYYYECHADELDTVGFLSVRFSKTGIRPFIKEAQVVAFDPYDGVRAGLTGLPNAAAGSNGGLPTVDANNAVKVQSGTGSNQIDLSSGQVKVQYGTSAGQISASSGVVNVNVSQCGGSTVAAGAIPNAAAGATGGLPTVDSSGRTSANLVAIDGQATTGNNATLNLKQLNIVNNAGDAMILSATGGGGFGLRATGNGIGPGIYCKGGATGSGLYCEGGSSAGIGIYAQAPKGHGIYAVGTGVSGASGIYAESAGNNGHGIYSQGNGTGAGSYAKGGATGHGTYSAGGADGGDGLYLESPSGNRLSSYVVQQIQSGLATSVEVADVQSTADAIETDTQDIQSRLPAALVDGRIDASVGEMQDDTVTAGSITAGAAGEIADAVCDEALSGHTTAGTVGKALADAATDAAGARADTEDIQARLPATLNNGRIRAHTEAMSDESITDTTFTNEAVTRLQSGMIEDVQESLDSLDARIPAALVGGRMDASIGAMQSNTLTASAVAAGAITASGIASDAITAAKIQDGALTASKIASNAITADKIADGAIDAGAIETGAITSAKFAAGAITASVIATGAVDADALASDAVAEIQSGLATAANVQAVRDDTEDIQGRLPAALVSGRIDASVGDMQANTITATAIASNAITAAKIATDAIDADAVAQDVIDEISENVTAGPSAAAIADAVWDEAHAGHLAVGSVGLALQRASTAARLASVVSSGEVTDTDIVLYRGAEQPAHEWTILDSAGNPIDLSDEDVELELRVYRFSPVLDEGVPTPVFVRTSEDGHITVGGSQDNELSITFTAANLATPGVYRYEIRRVDDGENRPLARGDLTIKAEDQE